VSRSRLAAVVVVAAFPLAVRAQTASVSHGQAPSAPVVGAPVAGAGDGGSVAYLQTQYVADMAELHSRFAALAGAIPAERFAWRPAVGARSVSEVLMHVAGEWSALCPISVAAKPSAEFTPMGPGMKRLELVTAKADVQTQLERSWAACQTALAAATPAQLVPAALPAKMPFARVVLLFTADQHEHLGQLVAYARSVGVTPPWSK
jgi:uncharacterized damage-inducible protein DinB